MDRRKFLRWCVRAGVAAGATASVGLDLSHFLSWLTRNPRWSFPTPEHPVSVAQYEDYVEISDLALATSLRSLATIYYDRKAIAALKDNLLITNIQSRSSIRALRKRNFAEDYFA